MTPQQIKQILAAIDLPVDIGAMHNTEAKAGLILKDMSTNGQGAVYLHEVEWSGRRYIWSFGLGGFLKAFSTFKFPDKNREVSALFLGEYSVRSFISELAPGACMVHSRFKIDELKYAGLTLEFSVTGDISGSLIITPNEYGIYSLRRVC